jgi:hypothetical protein
MTQGIVNAAAIAKAIPMGVRPTHSMRKPPQIIPIRLPLLM